MFKFNCEKMQKSSRVLSEGATRRIERRIKDKEAGRKERRQERSLQKLFDMSENFAWS